MTDYGSMPTPEPEPADHQWLAHAIATVQPPGAFLQWYGLISLFFAVASLIVYLVSPDTIYKRFYDAMQERRREQQKEEDAPAATPLPPYKKWVQQQALWGTIGSILSLVGSFLVAIGGMKMRHLSGYGWAVIGSFMAILPCSNSCCCIGLPIGIWSLVILFGSDVRLAFTRVGEAGGLEAFSDDMRSRDGSSSRPIRLE